MQNAKIFYIPGGEYCQGSAIENNHSTSSLRYNFKKIKFKFNTNPNIPRNIFRKVIDTMNIL